MLGLVVFLYAFSSGRNKQRNISATSINFKGDNNLFVTKSAVSKLLIQNQGSSAKAFKETLDLNGLETALNSNEMIRTAEVFLDIDGTLNAVIEQKQPIARVSTNASYYVDSEGGYMPLSANFSARVPLVTGVVEKNNLSNIHEVAKKVISDEFLKTHVIEIHQNANSTIDLKLRKCKFMVHLGKIKQLDKKINNLKVFFQKALKEKALQKYSRVNLQFDNQVVCTKD